MGCKYALLNSEGFTLRTDEGLNIMPWIGLVKLLVEQSQLIPYVHESTIAPCTGYHPDFHHLQYKFMQHGLCPCRQSKLVNYLSA